MKAIECECNDRCETKINTSNLFKEIKSFFDENLMNGIFDDIEITNKLKIYDDNNNVVTSWYPTKWYKCNVCGQIWAVEYSDFPAIGAVYKLTPKGEPIESSVFWNNR